MTEDFFSDEVPLLYAFLVTRQIFAGVGRVGGHILAEAGSPDYESMARNPIDYIWVSQIYNVYADENRYQLSQRADHILRTIASRVRFNRALINPKWEHFYAHEGMHRLHMLFGEANQSQFAYKLKVGTTALVLRLLEDGDLAKIPEIDNPLVHLRTVSRDESYNWEVTLQNGDTTNAVDLQMRHLDLAEKYRGDSADTDWVLDNWREVLETLSSDPRKLADRLDWVAKLAMIEAYVADAGIEWGDDALHSIDLEYHNIDPETSLFYALQDSGQIQSIVDPLKITESMFTAPCDTRARGRSQIVKHVMERTPEPYMIDWSGAVIGRSRFIEMPDPFHTYSDVVAST